MTPEGQKSFNFGDKPLSLEREDPYEFFEGENECQYCGHPYDSADSCKYCKGDKTKLAYLKRQEEKPLPSKPVFDKNEPASRGSLIIAEMERLRKIRPDIATNDNALRAIAEINVSAAIDPPKLKPPEDPNYH
jgi:hypothetical protein